MKLLTRLVDIFDRVINALGFFAATLSILAAVIVTIEVCKRYFLGGSISWVWEYTSFSLLYITFLGAAWVLKREEHVKMDLVLNLLRPKSQCLVNIITSIVGAATSLLLTVYGAWITIEEFRTGATFETPMHTPRFVVFAVIPLGLGFVSIQFLRRAHGFLRSYETYRTQGWLRRAGDRAAVTDEHTRSQIVKDSKPENQGFED